MKQSKKKSEKRITAGVTIDPKMRSYSNDPLVIKKGKEAQEFLRKAGFPDPSLYKK